MTEQEAYAQALRELTSRSVDEGIWAKAIAFSDANEERAKANYLKFRAEHLVGIRPRKKLPKWIAYLFLPHGRIGRGELFVMNLSCVFALGAFALSIEKLFGKGSDVEKMLIVPSVALAVWISLMLIAKRLHDVGRSAWLALLALIPYLNFVFGLLLLIGSGSKGMNRYGAREDMSLFSGKKA
jgi:Predicted membrane protein